MRQLALKIQSAAPPTLDNYVCGRNAEALASLRSVVSDPAHDALVYLWGAPGSGKSHLLLGLAQALRERGLHPRLHHCRQERVTGPFPESLLLLDDVDALSPAAAEALFHAWNRIREAGGLLVCSGADAAGALPLDAAVASRLAWGSVHRLHGLDDAEKLTALNAYARSLAMPVSDDALPYLLKRAPRDLRSLLALLDGLDARSLADRRPVTVALVRDFLHAHTRIADPKESLCD